MNPYTIIKNTSFYLSLIGALNWGLIGAFDFNLVTYLLGIDTALTNAIYLIVGLSALFLIIEIIYRTASINNSNYEENHFDK